MNMVARTMPRASETQLLSGLESATDYAVVTTDLAGVITGWNTGAEQIMGWAKAEALGHGIDLIFTPEDRAARMPEEERHLAQLHGQADDERWHLKSTGRFWASGKTMPLRDADGGLVGYLKILRDETRRHEAVQALLRSEAALAQSEAQFRATFEQSAVGIAHVGLDGRWLRVNTRLCSILGYTEDELLATRLEQVTPIDEAGTDLAPIRQILAGELATYTVERRYLHRDGQQVWVDLTVSLARDKAGVPQYFIAVSQPIDARKQAEGSLRASEEKLRHTQKLEAIGRLAAGVAHDFNNLLQVVSGGLELILQEVEAGSPASEFAELALGSARRGAELTHHLLAYARKQMLMPRTVHLPTFLTRFQRLLGRTLGPQITVRARAAAGTPSIKVDPGQLETALLNLALNAAHAMPQGGTLLMDAHLDRHDRTQVVIAVTDTGVGMDKATVAQVFEPFFTTKGLDGTGLGLSMVQGFAEQSGGHASIASAPGKGTTVMLWLPVVAEAMAIEEGAPEQHEGPWMTGSVLVVDDVPDVLATTEALLERAGFTVVTASNGEEGLALLGQGEFDAVVSDQGMAGMSGAELIERARALRPHQPAVLITGFSQVDATDRVPGSIEILRKPFQRRELIDAVSRALERIEPAGVDGRGDAGGHDKAAAAR